MNNIVKTTMMFSPRFHHQLKRLSARMNKPMSLVVEELMSKVLEQEDQTQRDRLYTAMDAIRGIVKDDITDASTTIDQVLYGKERNEEV